jgi:hypothetical protein
VIFRLAIALAALVDLAVARLFPESGGGLFLRLGAATIVVLVPGGLVAEALGLRSPAATLVWASASLALALGLVFLLSTSFSLALWVLLAVALAAILFGRGGPRPRRIRGTGTVLAGGILLGALLWHVASGAVRGDALFHLARVRRLVDLGDLTPWRLQELVHGGLHPGYAFPLWHAFLAAVAKVAGVDPSLVVRHESALLVPLALAVSYEAGAVLFRSASLGVATMLAQVGLICFAPGHGGAYTALALPATAARQLLVPAVLALVFTYVREPSRTTLLSVGVGALGIALVHPTYALFLALPLAGWLVARALTEPRDVRRIAEALLAVAAPAGAVALSLLPLVRDTISHNPSRSELERELAHYGNQLVVHGGSYHLAPAVFVRGGAVAVAALLAIPLTVLARERHWSSFVLGGSLLVFAFMLVPTLFVQLSEAVSLSQSRRAASFLPFAFAFAGGASVLARLLGVFVLPSALAAGVVLQLTWPGDFGYRLTDGGPAWATWFAVAGGAAAFLLAAALPNRVDLERRGLLAALAAALFVTPVAVHGFAHWSPAAGSDPHALTPGLVRYLRDDVPERAVVFSDLETSYRIAAEAPVLVAAEPPAHVADTKRNRPRARRADVLAFFRTGDLAIPMRYGAGWLVLDRLRPHPRLGLRPAYADTRYLVYSL